MVSRKNVYLIIVIVAALLIVVLEVSDSELRVSRRFDMFADKTTESVEAEVEAETELDAEPEVDVESFKVCNCSAVEEKFKLELGGIVRMLNKSDEVPTGFDRSRSAIDFEVWKQLKSDVNCRDKEFESVTEPRGNYWVFRNFIKAEHGSMFCFESLTYTTHGDYTFLEHLVPVLLRWNAPLSMAIFTPGYDLDTTMETIRKLRMCGPHSALVRRWATFHIFFPHDHFPESIPRREDILSVSTNCSASTAAPANNTRTYKETSGLLYPINIARNIARDAALTLYVLASDVELYPSPGIPRKFLEMVHRKPLEMSLPNPRVFPLSLFEVNIKNQVPQNKTELQQMLRNKTAIPFHARVCPTCHRIPNAEKWVALEESSEENILHVAKRTGAFGSWEPIYIGTNHEPFYEERLSWEGKSDKMSQGYIMCILNYDFMVLSDSFLVHAPGIKVYVNDPKRNQQVGKTQNLISKTLKQELLTIYGEKDGCKL